MKKQSQKFLPTSCAALFCLFMLTTGVTQAATGSLSLVSMGTGDPENMTLRAHKTIEAADLFFSMGGKTRYPELTKGKPVYDAEHGLFNKGGAKPRKSAEEAEKLRVENRKIIREAVSAGKHVVVLDNGDPTVFSPHIGYMEEFSDLNTAIIPGISSFNAANAALKTSVISNPASAVMLTTGSLRNGRDTFLAKAIDDGVTLALFMVRDLDGFITKMGEKVSKDTPVAIVSNAGSSSKEMVLTATLGTLGERVKGIELGPYLLYIGASVKQ